MLEFWGTERYFLSLKIIKTVQVLASNHSAINAINFKFHVIHMKNLLYIAKITFSTFSFSERRGGGANFNILGYSWWLYFILYKKIKKSKMFYLKFKFFHFERIVSFIASWRIAIAACPNDTSFIYVFNFTNF